MVPPLQAYCENSPVNTLYTHIQASLVAQTMKNLPAMQETQVQLWVRKSPWEREWLPTPVFLPGESHIFMLLISWDLWVRCSQWLVGGLLPTPVFLPGEFYGQRSLAGYSLGAVKSRTQLSD